MKAKAVWKNMTEAVRSNWYLLCRYLASIRTPITRMMRVYISP